MEFTKEIKNEWIKALESGEYTQGFGALVKNKEISISGKTEHCCLGVLGDIHPGLENKVHGFKKKENINPYRFLDSAVSEYVRSRLVNANDADAFEAQEGKYEQDYSNVLPMIRQLKTVD